MLREILKDQFMDCEKVKRICIERGFSRPEVRKAKKREGIKTVEIQNSSGAKKWLWFVPEEIWEKY